MNVLRRVAGTFIILCLFSPFAYSQGSKAVDLGKPQPTPTPDANGPMSMNVYVTDKAGAPVTGLDQQNFSLQVDKQTVPITAFRKINTTTDPVEVIILVDTVNTRFNYVAIAREQIDKYLTQNGGKLANPTRLILFTDTGTQIMPKATTDGNALRAVLDKTGVNLRDLSRDSGFYGYLEEMDLSTRTLLQIANFEATRPGRKVLLWISPGWRPLTGPEVELTDKQQKQLFGTLVSVSTAMRRAKITMSSIDPLGTIDAVSFRTFYYQEFLKGVTKPSQMQIGNLLLEVFAIQSGGRVMNSSNDVVKLIATCAADANDLYSVSFMPPANQHIDQYHEIKIGVDQPKETAHSLTGFYGQPPQAGGGDTPAAK